MKYQIIASIVVILSLSSVIDGQSTNGSSLLLKREKKQIYRYVTVDNPEEHHGHSHHHHPDAHFPGAPYHHHHGTEQTDHVASRAVVVPGRQVVVKTEHVDTSHRQRTETTHVKPATVHTLVTGAHYYDPIHVHHADPPPHKAPPGYPSSDYVRYYAKYTSRGGTPVEAAHSYYRDHGGHLYNYDVEPRFAAPKYVADAHVHGIPAPLVATPLHDADVPALSTPRDPLASARNVVAAGNNFHYRVETGAVGSPSGKGPHHGFYYGTQPFGGKLLVGNREIRF